MSHVQRQTWTTICRLLLPYDCFYDDDDNNKKEKMRFKESDKKA